MSQPTERDAKIVITGGGSGGHTVTALSVYDELVARTPKNAERIVYIGSSKVMEGEKGGKSVEQRMAEARGITFVSIRSGKLQRQFSIKTLTGLLGVFGGIIDAMRFFRNNCVSAVFSSGGYVTVPVCFAAWLHRVPIIIHEQTTRVGLSNKISGRFAKKILIGYPDAANYFPKKKTKFVGNTIRKGLLDKKAWSTQAVAKMRSFKAQSEQFPIVLISGGGQGSHLMNSTVTLALKSLVNNFQLIVLTGDNKVNRDYDKLMGCMQKLTKKQQNRIVITKFAQEKDLGPYLDAADVYVGRSGALSVYEVGTVGIPSIMIPIPWVTHNEQYHNAQVLEGIGLANIVSEGILSPEILFQEIQRMVTRIRGGILRINEIDRGKVFVTNAADNIVDELENYVIL